MIGLTKNCDAAGVSQWPKWGRRTNPLSREGCASVGVFSAAAVNG